MSNKNTSRNDVIAKMTSLNDTLKEAARAYYNKDREIMSNYEYDALYDELVSLEDEHGVLLPDSITQSVGVDVDDGATNIYSGTSSDAPAGALPKIEHATPMLSLDKTKSRSKLADWLGDKDGCLSWKLDGSTVVVTYDNGKMTQAVTRGNGRIGEDITEQARKFAGVPDAIAHKGHLVIRGEAVMTYSEFERINATIDDVESKYKNPRNLASGTMRALDASILDEREIRFCPFTLVDVPDTTDMEGAGFDTNSYSQRLEWLSTLGFTPVEHYVVNANDIEAQVNKMEGVIENEDIPSDGLVLFFDDIEYGDSLGSTSHAPKNGIAFKWADETASTRLLDIVWQPSRTGRINPVAIFEPVQLEGTTVERATLNNVTFMADMFGVPYIGQKLEVYKANKIIPTIVAADKSFPARGHEMDAKMLYIPYTCPSCGNPVGVVNEHGSDFLMCANPECPAKSHGSLVHFASRDALDIHGLSKETLSKLMDAGIVASYKDILNIADAKNEVVGHIEGIGEKSFDNLAAAVENARKTTAARFLYSLGIREIGRSASTDIMKAYKNDFKELMADAISGDASVFEKIDGVGEIMSRELCDYMTRNENMLRELLDMIEITDAGKEEKIMENDAINGKTFVVTGAVHIFKKRSALKVYVAERGGKVAGSISKNTDYLITNEPDSGSVKNKKAQELGVAIITEEEFCEMAGYEA